MPSLTQYKSQTTWKPCHTGNNKLFSIEQEKNSGKFLVGGWSKEAKMITDSYVIDLTGMKTLQVDIEAQDDIAKKAFKKTIAADSKVNSTGILHLYIPDGKTPYWPREVWKELADEVYAIMESGKDILVCCLGGHGRTGIAASILAHIIDPDMVGKNPVQWVRDIYCEKVVENQKQIDYIFDVLELGNAPKKLKGSKLYNPIIKQGRFHSQLSKEHENDGKICKQCKQSYFCKKTCNPPIHEIYQVGAKGSIDNWEDLREDANLHPENMNSAEWATYLGHSW